MREFEEGKQNSKNYLRGYYQSRVDFWKGKPNSEKIVEHYEKAAKSIS